MTFCNYSRIPETRRMAARDIIEDSPKESFEIACGILRLPPAQNQYCTCRKNSWVVHFAQIHAGPVFALARIQENTLEESFSKCFAKVLGEFISGANLCRACIRTSTNTGTFSWRFLYVLVRARGYSPNRGLDMQSHGKGFHAEVFHL